MEIEFFGANCFRIKTKKASIVVDDNLSSIGGKSVSKDTDVAVFTNKEIFADKKTNARLTLESAGEFEIGDISVRAVQARSHLDESDQNNATVFQFLFGGTTVTVLGHIHPELSGEVLELASGTDVAVIPVGGNGFTLDGVGALSVIKKIEPSVVIPSSYSVSHLKYEVPASTLEEFVQTSGLTAAEPKDIYKVDKPDAELASQTHLVILNSK